jgi:hypothetical protein
VLALFAASGTLLHARFTLSYGPSFGAAAGVFWGCAAAAAGGILLLEGRELRQEKQKTGVYAHDWKDKRSRLAHGGGSRGRVCH